MLLRLLLVAVFALACAIADAQTEYASLPASLEPSPGEDRANVPIVGVKGNTWYLDVAGALEGDVELYHVDEPACAVVVGSGASVAWSYEGETVKLALPVPSGQAYAVAVSWELDKWREQMGAFARQDQERPPLPGGVVFTGSSTIVAWDLERSFPGLGALNRGFGGSQYAESVHCFDQTIRPYRPSTVVLYSGDNDIASGKSPERVFADFRALLCKIQHHSPEARVIALAIKPSLSRWDRWPAMEAANALIAAYAAEHEGVVFVDIATPLLGDDGKPRTELYLDDQLHLNAAGYDVLTGLLRPLLPGAER